MPDVTYGIVIEAEEDAAKKKEKDTTAPSPGGNVTAEKTGSASEDKPGAAPLIKALKRSAAVGFALSAINMAADMEISTIQVRTGNALLQERISYAYGTARKAASLAASVGFGLAVGGAAGAVSGAIIYGGTQLMNFAVRSARLSISSNAEREQMRFMQNRAGAGASRQSGGGY